MRTLFGALAACALFLTSLNASADVLLVRADSIGSVDSDDMNHHRYDNSIKKMDSESDRIASQLLIRDRNAKVRQGHDNSGMQVTLIKIRR